MATSLPFFSSKSNVFPPHSSVLMEYTWPPITGAGSNCQNMRAGLAAENPICGNACLQVSHALDDDPRGNTITQLWKSFFSCLRSSCESVVHVYFLISLMHWFMFSTLIIQTPSPRLQSKHCLPQLQLPWPYRSSAALQRY